MDDEHLKRLRAMAGRRLGAPIGDIDELGREDVVELLQELQIHQIELEMQNQELSSSRDELEYSRDRYIELYNNSPVGHCTLDVNHMVLEVNATLLRMLKSERRRLLKRSLVNLVVKEDLPIFLHIIKPHLKPLTTEFRMVDSEQSVIHVRVSSRIEEVTGQGPQVVLAIENVTEHKELTAQLRIKSLAVEETQEGVFVTNSNNEIIYLNPAFEQSTGRRREEMMGRDPELLFTRDHQGAFHHQLWHQLLSEGGWDGEVHYHRKSGEVYPVHLTLNVVSDDQGNPSHYVGIFYDISLQKERERALQQAQESAENAAHAKSNFLSSMSHELRTPLTAIIGNGEMLGESPLDDDQQQLLRSMSNASRSLLSLVNDILDHSKIESGKFHIDDTPFTLDTLLDEVVDLFQVTAHDALIDFSFKQTYKPQWKLWGDGKRVGQILINLLSNAMKFTDKQGWVSLQCDRNQAGMVALTVCDSGIGMSEEVLGLLTPE